MNLVLLVSIAAWSLVSVLEADTSSLEELFPGKMHISRTLSDSGEIVHYGVNIYDFDDTAPLVDLILLVSDASGTQLVRAPLESREIWDIPPNENKYLLIRFSVHSRLEKNALIEVGRANQIRVRYTQYRLPLKTIKHPKADKGGADQAANANGRKPKGGKNPIQESKQRSQ